jgi:hypothetical protein
MLLETRCVSPRKLTQGRLAALSLLSGMEFLYLDEDTVDVLRKKQMALTHEVAAEWLKASYTSSLTPHLLIA